jgi:integrase
LAEWCWHCSVFSYRRWLLRALGASPCHRVRLPRDDRPLVVAPTVEQVTALAAVVPARSRALVVLLAGSGLRIGEALGLNVAAVDFLRRTVKVESHRLPSGRIGPPKTPQSARTVPLGQVVIDELAAHLAAHPSDGPLFTITTGKPLAYRTWRAIRAGAGKVAALDVDTQCAAALLRERADRGHVRALVARR